MRALALASVVAICLANQAAWGHRFPPVRQVVVQVERCEVVLLVGYRPATGEATDTLVARVSSAPKSRVLDALRDLLATSAMTPLTIAVDGKPLTPTGVRAKLGIEPGGARPMVVLLVSYALPSGHSLSVTTTDPRNMRISWQDQSSGRVAIPSAPAQGTWHTGVASFLLGLAAPSGGLACATVPSSFSDSSSSAAR